MKKILAGLAAGAMIFQTSAFADTLTEAVEILSSQYTSASINFDTKFTLNKPMDFLGAMQKAEEEGPYYYEHPVDYQMLFEGLFDSEYQMEMKVDASPDYKKMDIEIQGDISLPAKINENWTMTNDAKFGIWYAMDFTDAQNFKYEMTIKHPFSRKYMHMDLAKQIGSPEIFTQNPILSEEIMNELREKSKEIMEDSLRESADIEKEGSKYIISFDNNGFIGFLEKYLTGVFEITNEIIEKTDAGLAEETIVPEADSDYIVAGLGEFNEYLEKLKSVNILGEKGFVIEIDTALGVISDMNVLCDIDLNIYDLLALFEADIPEYITKDNSSIAFTAEFGYKYSDIDNTEVTFPELTEDNCNYLFEEAEEEYYEYNYESYYYTHAESFYHSAEGYSLRGFDKVPHLSYKFLIWNYAEDCSKNAQNYRGLVPTWQDGIITFTDPGDLLKFDTIVLNSKTDEAFIDGVKVNIEPKPYKHIVVAYGSTYISPELANALFGTVVENYKIDFDGYGNALRATVRYEYPNPNYEPEKFDL